MPASLPLLVTAVMKTISRTGSATFSARTARCPAAASRPRFGLPLHRPKAAASANDLFSTPTGDQETP